MTAGPALNVVRDAGTGPVLVLLHGVENDGTYWRSMSEALESRYRLIALDLLGFGGSPRPEGSAYALADHLGALEPTLDAIRAGERFTLVGHSLGSIISAAYARLHPERVERLVLFSPPVRCPGAPQGDTTADRLRARFVESFGDLKEKGEEIARHIPSDGVAADMLSRFGPSLLSLANTIEPEDMAGDLVGTPGLPVRVVYGSHDPLVAPPFVEALATLRAGIDVVRVTAGHDIATEHPALSASLVATEVR